MSQPDPTSPDGIARFADPTSEHPLVKITTLPGHYRSTDKRYDAVFDPATGTYVATAYRVTRTGGRHALSHTTNLPDLESAQRWADQHRAVTAAGVLR